MNCRKQKRTMQQLHADLVTLCFTDSYARVAEFARISRASKRSGGLFSRRLGLRIGCANGRRLAAEPLWRCIFPPAMASSLTGPFQ